jgi:hypothetical protein
MSRTPARPPPRRCTARIRSPGGRGAAPAPIRSTFVVNALLNGDSPLSGTAVVAPPAARSRRSGEPAPRPGRACKASAVRAAPGSGSRGTGRPGHRRAAPAAPATPRASRPARPQAPTPRLPACQKRRATTPSRTPRDTAMSESVSPFNGEYGARMVARSARLREQLALAESLRADGRT